jgi:hypothetical protein
MQNASGKQRKWRILGIGNDGVKLFFKNDYILLCLHHGSKGKSKIASKIDYKQSRAEQSRTKEGGGRSFSLPGRVDLCARGEPVLLAIPCENFGLVTGTNVCDKIGCFPPPPPPRLETGRVVPPLDAPPPQLITSLLSAGLTVCRLHWLEEGNTPPPQDAILYYSLSFLPYAPPPHSKIPLHFQSINKSINPHSYFEKTAPRSPPSPTSPLSAAVFSSNPDPEPDSGTGKPEIKVTTKLTSKGRAKTESI